MQKITPFGVGFVTLETFFIHKQQEYILKKVGNEKIIIKHKDPLKIG